MEHPIPLSGFIQIALVVSDMDRALDAWCRLFALPRPKVEVRRVTPESTVAYRGRQVSYTMKFAVLECRERGFVVELSEPDGSPSTFQEFLDKHGNGVHHLGFEVGEARDAVIAELEDLGFGMRTVGYYPGGSWTIVDSEDDLGVNLNVKPHA